MGQSPGHCGTVTESKWGPILCYANRAAEMPTALEVGWLCKKQTAIREHVERTLQVFGQGLEGQGLAFSLFKHPCLSF